MNKGTIALIATTVLLFFAAAFAAVLHQGWVTLSLLGIFFILLAILTRDPDSEGGANRSRTVIFIILGIVLLVIGSLIKFGPDDLIEKIKNATPLYFFGAFALVGLYMIISTIMQFIYRIRHCTYETEAICVTLDYRRNTDSEGFSNPKYTAVYEFEYMGGTKRVSNNDYTSHHFCPQVGTTAMIHVDPESCKDYYIGNPMNGLVGRLIGGLIFGGASLSVIILALLDVIKLG